MSGNNMSRMMSSNNNNEEYIFNTEEHNTYEQEIYEDVYDYEEECKIRKLIEYLERSRDAAINLSAYPHMFTSYSNLDLQVPMYVYIKNEDLLFMRNKTHVRFDEEGIPF